MRYTISVREGSIWVWAGDGTTEEGTTADLPREVLDYADAGEIGIVEVDGTEYRVSRV